MINSLRIFGCSLLLFLAFTSYSTVRSKAQTNNGLVYFYGYPFNTDHEIQQIANLAQVKRAEISIEWKDVFICRSNFDWSFVDKNIELWQKAGKTVILRIMTANNASFCTSSTLVEQEKIRLVAEGFFTDFEGDIQADGYTVMDATIAGNEQKYLEIKNNNRQKCEVIQLQNNKKLTPKASYLFQCDVTKLKKINSSKPAFIRVLMHSKSQPEQSIVVSEEIKISENQLFTEEFTLGNSDDYTLKIVLENAEFCQLDNLNLIQTTDSRYKRVAFPNYFSTNFKNTFSYFMAEMAKRYKNNPAVDAIVVSGLGRWEEMLLNDNEKHDAAVHESFYRQWRAFGYTDVNYLKNVVGWSMDLTNKMFPNKELILQISPMNNDYKNEDFIYRRAAAMAVSKGISIKQNGMSEKYDTWSATSDPAYLMNRYRFYPAVKTYYETSGQIFRNTMNAMGHPESLINRVIIDGVNNLYLYKSDLLEPNIQKYFSYADSLMNNPFVSVIYSELGEFPMANRKKQKFHLLDTIVYRNKWLGIRQYDMPGAMPDFVFDTTLKTKAISTNNQNRNIVFDIDDRLLYNGMASPVLTITYKDDGFDAFDVIVNSRKSGKYELLETVKKQNTQAFCKKSIPLKNHLQSADNFKETKPELVIDAKDDGHETIAALEIEFVPLHLFETVLVAQNGLSINYQAISKSDSLTTNVNYTVGKPLAKAEICYYDGDFSQKSDVLCRLLFNNDVSPVSEKQYYIGGDKEWIPLSVSSGKIPEKLRINIINKNGVNGTYLGKYKNMAYRLYCFKTFEKQPVKPDTNRVITIYDFFNSFTFEKDANLDALKIYKQLADKSLQSIDFEVAADKVYFTAQHPGKYKIVLNNMIVQPTSAGCLTKKIH